ncbi:3-phenylpropionate/cinnamic acid dioxygenase subunit beta [Microbacterium sp. LMC-P-041]|uniref:aromatic-ring-hydroxylating dioxygenase subunit beta n=1 Tax=Microbacterium sp. LMC-P-041 TaxID=3040293 RepID=UPI002557806C|nr:3-phenylpropionate/cinnamic acid dioxygenase subunit beta [Microbacterium sp. LMC-P-041]
MVMLSTVDRRVQEDIRDVMYREALALDERRFRDWLEFLTDDITYDVPLRVVREDLAEWELSPNGRIFQDNRQTLEVRVRRLETDFSWAEQPPSRTRHYITNVLIDATDVENEFEVNSSCFIYRSRGDSIDPNLLSVARKDLIRLTEDGYRLARRWAAIDQAVINAHNLSIFI